MPSPKLICCILSLYFFWLIAWIGFSWGAVQDDAMIHLRYAHNLLLHAAITYDGTHTNYGASSLLYVSILALLERMFLHSPNLARAVSSATHLLLFAGLAAAFGLYLPRTARAARLAALILLALLVVPSAVRWLDDGMETGLVLALVTLLAWLLHGQADCCCADEARGWQTFLFVVVPFLAVLLRTELLLLCAVGFLMLALGREKENRSSEARKSVGERFIAAMPILVGAGTGLAVIVGTMHTLLPDTAVAKSLGIDYWLNPIHDTAVTLGGAFSFGIGMLMFWLLTLSLVVMRRGRLTVRGSLANCFFPVVLTLSALRGQEIQGVRYFSWTFFFSTTWNILELAAEPEHTLRRNRQEALLLYAFIGLLIAILPFESVAMGRVLRHRAETVSRFEMQHLDVLRKRHGMASDIGYIGYFSQADICDLAGLVNGRAAARMSQLERARACASIHPDFVFLNASQMGPMARIMDFSQWKICGRYDFTNVRTADTHYLMVRPGIATEVCGATGTHAVPINSILSESASLR